MKLCEAYASIFCFIFAASPNVSASSLVELPPVNHDFDFWIGEWEVTNQADGKLAGHSRIEPRHVGRVIVEHYATPGAYTGMSLNAYDSVLHRWHQCWMDSSGGVLDLYGGIVEGKMVLTGETPQTGGGRQLERISWTPNADGTVRQHWMQSVDEGKTWTTAFDGLYRKKSGGVAASE